MIEHLFDHAWWNLPTSELPEAFRLDQNSLEIGRVRSLLIAGAEPTADDVQRRSRRAATLLEISALGKNVAGERHTWEIVALIYETLGLFAEQDYRWLLSSLTWQLAEAPSIASLLAGRLRGQNNFESRDAIERMAIAFSLRNFNLLQVIADQAVEDGVSLKNRANSDSDIASVLEATLLLSSGIALSNLAEFVLFSSPKLPVIRGLEDFVALAQVAGHSRRFRIGRLLLECVRLFLLASSRFLISQLPLESETTRDRILQYLKQYPDLWPSQQKAINLGLLNPSKSYFVVAVPTSSGKTLCGELVIIQTLTENSNSVCFYVVPTRALVTEKTKELNSRLGRLNFVIKEATSALQRDEIEAELLADAHVIVCTPEKLDLLIRHDDDLLGSGSLFIIDETQMVADDNRGLGLEFVVIKLLLLKPSARIILLSAMLSNSEDFGRWLSRETTVASSEWRPTRQRFGEIIFREIPNQKGSTLELSLYATREGFDEQSINLVQYPRRAKSITEKTIWAVEALRNRGPVLVFCMTKSRCEDIAEEYVIVQILFCKLVWAFGSQL